MGLFCANVHVSIRGSKTKLTPRSVRQALQGVLKASGWVESSEAEPVRQVAFRIPKAGSWVSVYDDLAEQQDPAVLQRLAEGLSSELSSPAVSVLVHDSDELLMNLYVGGQSVDELRGNHQKRKGVPSGGSPSCARVGRRNISPVPGSAR